MDENKEFENREPQDDSYITDPAEAPETEPHPAPAQTDSGEAAWAEAAKAFSEPGPDQPPQDDPPQHDPQEETPAEYALQQTPGEVVPAAEAAAPAPKSGKGIFALIGVVVALLCLIVGVLVASQLNKSPEDAVAAAFSKTGAAVSRMAQRLQKQLPFAQLGAAQKGAKSKEFKVAFDSINLGEGMSGGELMNAMFRMFSISGNVVSDPNSEFLQLNGQVNMGETVLLDVFAEYTPDQISFNVPKFSDTVLSIDPNTFAEDVKNNPYYSYMDDNMIRAWQDQIMQQADKISVMSNFDVEKFQREAYEIMWGALDGAVYQEPVKNGNQKVYTVQLDGAQVKKTVAALARYVYVDSDLAKFYQGEAMDMLREMVIDPMEENLPSMPITMVMTVGKRGLITQVDFNMDTSGIPMGTDETLDEISLSYALPDGVMVHNMRMVVAGASKGVPMNITMDATADYTGYNCKVDVALAANMEPMYMGMVMNMDAEKAGPVDMGMTFELNDGYSEGKMEAKIAGTVTKEKNVLKWDFPTIKMSLSSDSFAYIKGEVGFGLTASGQVTKLKRSVQPVNEPTPLLSLSEEELNAEMEKYYAGMQELFGQIYGSMPSTGSTGALLAPGA